MSNRTTTTLGVIAEIITGPFGSMLHQSDYVAEGTPVIMPQDIGNRTFEKDEIAYVDDKNAQRLVRYRVQKNDIVYARRGDVEKHAFVEEEDVGALCGTGCMRVRVDETKADPLYVSFYLNRPESKRWITQHAVGSNMLNLNTQILCEVPLELPSLQEQAEIAEVLNHIDKKIQNNKKICAELEHILKTIYDYWFTQFDFPNINGKPYRTSGGAMEWNMQIKRNIPKDWEAHPLSYIIANINTGLNPRDNFILGNGDIQYITVKNLTCEGTIDFNGCDTVDENARQIIHKRSDIQTGDILFASIAPLGRCYLIQNTPENWDINESVFSIRANTDRITPEYLYMYFMSEGFIKSATSSSTGSIFKGIRISTLSDMIAVVPPKHIAESFSGQIKSILELKEQKNAENQELIKLRDWLLPMLMNGQVTVTDPMPSAHILEFNNQKHEQYDVRQAARSFGEDSTDDTADLVKEFIKRRKNESKS